MVRRESGRMNYFGDRLHSVECTADAKTSKDAVQAPADSNVPCAIDSASFPRAVDRRD